MSRVWSWQDEDRWEKFLPRHGIWSVAQLMSVPDSPPEEGDAFGRWRYLSGALDLDGYWIEMSRCRTREELGDWVSHLIGKGWITPEDLGWFVYAVTEIWHAT